MFGWYGFWGLVIPLHKLFGSLGNQHISSYFVGGFNDLKPCLFLFARFFSLCIGTVGRLGIVNIYIAHDGSMGRLYIYQNYLYTWNGMVEPLLLGSVSVGGNHAHRIHVWYTYTFYSYIYLINQPNVDRYTIHGSFGGTTSKKEKLNSFPDSTFLACNLSKIQNKPLDAIR